MIDKIKIKAVQELFESQNEIKAYEEWIEIFKSALSLSVSESKKLIEDLIRNEYVLKLDNKLYFLDGKRYVIGSFRAVRETFAFVETTEESYYIASKDFNNALDMDDVLIEIMSDEKKYGVVLGIVKHQREFLLGTLEDNVFVPFDRKINHKVDHVLGSSKAKNGDRVIGKITEFGTELEVEIISVLGKADEPGMDVMSVLYVYGIDLDFDPEVLDEVKTVPDKVLESDLQGRVDHRDQYVITIDGEDAKDLDDAIYMESRNNGYRLYVHIADVSHYVKKGSAIDRSALDRASSVYTVDRVVPMLPKELSNGICSLHPHVDRLTMTAQIDLDFSGEIVDYHVYESIIQSKQRMSYREVNEGKDFGQPTEMIEMMFDCASRLKHRRDEAGSIGFDSEESLFIIDHNGKVLDIQKRQSGEAEEMIEAFMVIANEVVARKTKKDNIPVLYRVHEHPTKEKMQDLSHTLRILGYRMKGSLDGVKPKTLQRALDHFKELPQYPVVSRLMLRSMSKARYSPDPIGHFGLALDDYAHFTSPIRRYPDLMLHQRLKQYSKKVKDSIREADFEYAEEAGLHVSQKERSILEAERYVEKVKKAQFMQDKVGERFIAYISGVSNFGMYVELPNTVEGLIHVRTLRDDYYTFDATSQKLIGERTKKEFSVGQKLNVKLVSVDELEWVVNFEIIRERNRGPRKGRPRHERRRKKS